jgi:hypothetical protein
LALALLVPLPLMPWSRRERLTRFVSLTAELVLVEHGELLLLYRRALESHTPV